MAKQGEKGPSRDFCYFPPPPDDSLCGVASSSRNPVRSVEDIELRDLHDQILRNPGSFFNPGSVSKSRPPSKPNSKSTSKPSSGRESGAGSKASSKPGPGPKSRPGAPGPGDTRDAVDTPDTGDTGDTPNTGNTPDTDDIPESDSNHGSVYEPDPTMHYGSCLNPKNWSPLPVFVAVMMALFIVTFIINMRLSIGPNSDPFYSEPTYSLVRDYSGITFFDNFRYFSAQDPHNGFVHYVNQSVAANFNLTYASERSAIIRVDTLETVASTGRKSVRLQSLERYDNGLFLFDILHAPYGCGTWPAISLTDPAHWPIHGEVDIVESINTSLVGNQITLHAPEGCDMENIMRKQTGKTLTTDCFTTDHNPGCVVQGPPATHGEEFNKHGGGVYAAELRAEGIRIWFFNRTSIPQDIIEGTSPNPHAWGLTLADFPMTHCDLSNIFVNQTIVAGINLCGDWAGKTTHFNTEASCPGICSQYVMSNASAFDEAYWEIRSFKVYQVSKAG